MTRIYLTGRIALEHDGRLAVDEPLLPGRQGRVLFAYLALHLHDPVPRSELVELLWGDDQPEEAQAALADRQRDLPLLERRIVNAIPTRIVEADLGKVLIDR